MSVIQLSPLEKAKLDLIGTYAINSLFWSKYHLVYTHESNLDKLQFA